MRRGWLVGCLAAAALQTLATVDCTSDEATGPSAGDAGCTSEAGIAAYGALADGSPSCSACLQSTCADTLTACAGDCACTPPAMAALACIHGLGAKASSAAQTSCLGAMEGSPDDTTVALATCITTCAGVCGGVAPASECGDAGANLTSHFGSGSTACAMCVATSCAPSATVCAEDCACNATASSALDCLSQLGADASVAGMNTCVAPLVAMDPDSGTFVLGQCIVESCASTCGEPPRDASGDDAAGEDAGGDSGIADAGSGDATLGDAGLGDSGTDATSTDAEVDAGNPQDAADDAMD